MEALYRDCGARRSQLMRNTLGGSAETSSSGRSYATRTQTELEAPMDPIDALVAAVALSVISTLTVTFGIGWFRATRRVRELERQLNGAAPDTTIAQLETDLATLSENVEHLASGQDFLSRLVTERRQPPRVQQPFPEVTTPR